MNPSIQAKRTYIVLTKFVMVGLITLHAGGEVTYRDARDIT